MKKLFLVLLIIALLIQGCTAYAKRDMSDLKTITGKIVQINGDALTQSYYCIILDTKDILYYYSSQNMNFTLGKAYQFGYEIIDERQIIRYIRIIE